MTSLTLQDVAELLGVSVRTVEAWITGGELRAVNVSRDNQSRKPRLRILQKDLESFLSNRATVLASPTRNRRRNRPAVPDYV